MTINYQMLHSRELLIFIWQKVTKFSIKFCPTTS